MIIILIITHMAAVSFGFMICAILNAASRSDDEIEKMKKENDRK